MKFPALLQGRSRRFRLITLGAAVLLLVIGLMLVLPSDDDAAPLPTTTVTRGPLRISLIENGTIRPRQQLILRNETNRTVNITQVAPEGTLVKKDDIILQFDDTEMMNQLVERRIKVQNSESGFIAAGEDLKSARLQTQSDIEAATLAERFAKLDIEKFIKGEQPQQVKSLESKITLAQEEHTLAKERVRWSQILHDEKYLSQSDLQRDELAAKKAVLNLELAQEDLRLYKDYTGKRNLAEFESKVTQTKLALQRTLSRTTGSIAQAEARHRASEASFREERARLRREEIEATKFTVRAPISGMVLYASSVDGRWRGDPVEVGLQVRPNTEIIFLPTADDYDVDILISEVNLNKITTGLTAQIKIDALPQTTFTGRLETIAALPDSSSRWLNPNLKLYKTSIALAPSEVPLRNGMSCQVEILVEDIANTLHVPLQAVVRERGRPVVYVMDGRKSRPRPVTLGRDNNRLVQILDGLMEGETILLTPPLGRDSQPVAPAPTS
ncbi:MAG: efflux RND transporter periplasmic adaptor subunit [Rariglobus sp.]